MASWKRVVKKRIAAIMGVKMDRLEVERMEGESKDVQVYTPT